MTDQKSDVMAVKEFFGLTTKETVAVKKLMPAQDLKQLGEGIRKETLNY